MSKMPAKKKSCFQITSVTQAQVAASSVTDDTESLDDLDESRTEDVSSEIFDVSRADAGVCERSSSEETLSNVGETPESRTPVTAPVNGGVFYRSIGTGRGTPHHLGGSMPVPAAAQTFVPTTHPVSVNNSAPASTPVAHAAPVSASCSSRFRVIKLDHGAGKSFRRGRWTCTEFYDKDSDSNANRTVDSIKPPVTPDYSIDRDSGIGVTVSAAFPPHAFENASDSSGYSAGPPAHPHPLESLHQGYSLAPQTGSGTSAFQPTGYTTTASEQQQRQAAAPQTFPSNGINGTHQGAVQKSPVMSSFTSQRLGYSALGGPPASQQDYRQQHFGSSAQNPSMSTAPAGLPTSRVPSPPISSAAPGAESPGGEAGAAQGVLLQMGNASTAAAILPESVRHQRVSHTQPSGGFGIAVPPSISTVTSHSSGHNAPAVVPGIGNTLLAGGLSQAQGARGGTATGLPFAFSHRAEDKWKSDALPQPGACVLPVKDGVKPSIGEGLDLPSPAVNSLFGIHISMNVDEDNASGASVVAIDNKIEQAMDLVKSHLMYAVREEVEVLKEHIKELYERNSALERENAVLKSLANSDQLGQLSCQNNQGNGSASPQQQRRSLASHNNDTPLVRHEGSQSVPHQPNITSA
ncbi:TSC22 domain family protein 2-like [Brachionichthys hirsutus]|uniref:TSC22 domain family protein 2-like n=1 Tax=Brachionichthys hirsutus TaxID=412623 RepID=UPI003604E28F